MARKPREEPKANFLGVSFPDDPTKIYPPEFCEDGSIKIHPKSMEKLRDSIIKNLLTNQTAG